MYFSFSFWNLRVKSRVLQYLVPFLGGHRPVDRPVTIFLQRMGLGSTPASPPRAASDADGDVRFYLFSYHPTELCLEQDA
jgi:hypothetical protein